jgi:hypothetical protein
MLQIFVVVVGGPTVSFYTVYVYTVYILNIYCTVYFEGRTVFVMSVKDTKQVLDRATSGADLAWPQIPAKLVSNLLCPLIINSGT